MKRVASHAIGCKVNQYESEAVAELFEKRGYEIVGITEKADIYIINTCSVTNLGDKKSRQLIRRVKGINPEAIVVASGCYSQVAPEDAAKIEGVNIIAGTKDRKSIVDIVESYRREEGVRNCVTKDVFSNHEFENLGIERLKSRTRAYIKIQDGCSQFCSYCIIPYARGPVRSRPPESVMAEIETLAANGFKEIVLSGIHVASYGKDTGCTDLADIIEKACSVSGIERIRLSSVEPGIITENFMLRAVKSGKLCAHFHLSLQSGCDKTLLAMNRKYTSEEYLGAVKTIRRHMPDASVTTDIITGFPGESEEDFLETLAFAEKAGFLKIHVFPYSAKIGTPAAKMKGQLKKSEKESRAKTLISLSEKMAGAFINARIGKTYEVLFEKENSDGLYEGYTSNYIRVLAPSEKDIKNMLLPVRLISQKEEAALGEIL